MDLIKGHRWFSPESKEDETKVRISRVTSVPRDLS